MQLELISKPAAGATNHPPLLFVHGAWHGAWCWETHFLDYFAEKGFPVHALSLRGHGGSEGRSRLRWTRLSEYVEDVARVAADLPERPVLVGHSMGGLVVQKFLEQRDAQAGVLVAPVPIKGVLGAVLRVARKHPVAFAKANLTLSLYPLVATPDRATGLLFAPRCPTSTIDACFEQLQDESYVGFLDMLAFNLAKPKRVSTPVMVIGGDKDGLFTVKEFQATAEAYGTEAVILPGVGHDVILDPSWQVAADSIIDWLSGQGL